MPDERWMDGYRERLRKRVWDAVMDAPNHWPGGVTTAILAEAAATALYHAMEDEGEVVPANATAPPGLARGREPQQ